MVIVRRVGTIHLQNEKKLMAVLRLFLCLTASNGEQISRTLTTPLSNGDGTREGEESFPSLHCAFFFFLQQQRDFFTGRLHKREVGR